MAVSQSFLLCLYSRLSTSTPPSEIASMRYRESALLKSSRTVIISGVLLHITIASKIHYRSSVTHNPSAFPQCIRYIISAPEGWRYMSTSPTARQSLQVASFMMSFLWDLAYSSNSKRWVRLRKAIPPTTALVTPSMTSAVVAT